MNIFIMNIPLGLSLDAVLIKNQVSPSRWQKSLQYKNMSDCNLSLLSYLLWRYATQSDNVEWELGEYAKPYISGGHYFNIGHTREWIACAVSEHGEVGIDIERQIQRNFFDVSELTMSAAERAAIKEYPALFYRFWTLKEAYLKWKGTGIVGDLAKLSFEATIYKGSNTKRTKTVVRGEYDGGYYISVMNHDYVFSAFKSKNDSSTNFREIHLSSLLNWISAL